MSYSEPSTIEQCRDIVLDATQHLYQHYYGQRERDIIVDYRHNFPDEYNRFFQNYYKVYLQHPYNFYPSEARKRAITATSRTICSGILHKFSNKGGRPRKRRKLTNDNTININNTINIVHNNINIKTPSLLSGKFAPFISNCYSQSIIPSTNFNILYNEIPTLPMTNHLLSNGMNCNITYLNSLPLLIDPTLTNTNFGNKSDLNNVKFFDKWNRKYYTLDDCTVKKTDELQEGWRENCLNYTNEQDKPHDSYCMRDDCADKFEKFEGEPCKNKHCIQAQIMEDNTNLYHEACLIRFDGGDSGYCCWCVIYFALFNKRLNAREYFETYLPPNAPHRIKSHFKIPKINSSILNHLKECKHIVSVIANCHNWNHFCLLSWPHEDGKQTCYFLISYQQYSHIALKREKIINYQSRFDEFLQRLKLFDHKPLEFVFPVLIYPHTQVDLNNSDSYYWEKVQVGIKSPHYDPTIEVGILQINKLWPKKLQDQNARMAIDLLFDAEKQRVKREIYTGAEYENNLWADANGSFAMAFTNFTYKINQALRQIYSYLKSIGAIISDKMKKQLNIPEKNRFNVKKCINAYDGNSVYEELEKENNHFIVYNLNRFLLHISSKHPILAHYAKVQLDPTKMSEQLIYKREPSRHQDDHSLFRPGKYKYNGNAVLCQNLINAEIKSDGSYIRQNKYPKHFCIDRLRNCWWGCNYGLPHNRHFTMYDKDRSIIVMTSRAAYYMPHKAEGTHLGWNSVYMVRNYDE